MKRNYLLFICILALGIMISCNRYTNPQLTNLEDSLDTDIEAMTSLEALMEIDRDSLTDTDRHYYDFLSVKIADKVYVRHTSDSLILSVVDY